MLISDTCWFSRQLTKFLHAVTMCGALTLVFLLGSASAEKQGYDSSQGLFFYQHIAKTGGTSLGEP